MGSNNSKSKPKAKPKLEPAPTVPSEAAPSANTSAAQPPSDLPPTSGELIAAVLDQHGRKLVDQEARIALCEEAIAKCQKKRKREDNGEERDVCEKQQQSVRDLYQPWTLDG